MAAALLGHQGSGTTHEHEGPALLQWPQHLPQVKARSLKPVFRAPSFDKWRKRGLRRLKDVPKVTWLRHSWCCSFPRQGFIPHTIMERGMAPFLGSLRGTFARLFQDRGVSLVCCRKRKASIRTPLAGGFSIMIAW